MSAPGLDKRLNQHARRAGLMVGISMALTIAVCIGSFVWIYAQVDPLTRDFVDQATVAPTKKAAASNNSSASGDEANSSGNATKTDSGNVQETDPTVAPKPTATSSSFKPTHQVSAEIGVNLRPGPAVNSGEPVANIEPGTELQYLGETKPSQDPDADGDLNWLKFRTENGQEGWIREVDVEPINSGQ